jgi:hypothetical protein
MNFTETFQEFSSKLGPTDLALYAGVGLVVWVLFRDKLGGVFNTVVNAVKGAVPASSGLPSIKLPVSNNNQNKFFELVSSWKKTRDLAEEVGCPEAVKVADQMFPFLAPQACQEKKA